MCLYVRMCDWLEHFMYVHLNGCHSFGFAQRTISESLLHSTSLFNHHYYYFPLFGTTFPLLQKHLPMPKINSPFITNFFHYEQSATTTTTLRKFPFMTISHNFLSSIHTCRIAIAHFCSACKIILFVVILLCSRHR